jgi:hypothetical protein
MIFQNPSRKNVENHTLRLLTFSSTRTALKNPSKFNNIKTWKCGTLINPLTPNDVQRRRAVSPLKIKIPSKNMREETNKYTNYLFNLLIMYGISYMFRYYIAIFRKRSYCLLRDAQLRSNP